MSVEASIDPSVGMARRLSFVDKMYARLCSYGAKGAGFISQPEPRTIGSYAKGKQLVAGNYQFGGHIVQAPDRSIWDLEAPDIVFEAEINGFTWLDDLASVGDGPSRKLAQAWVAQWIELHGKGTGMGWSPDLTGRRIIRWINHALFLLNGQDPERSKAYFNSLNHQARFLGHRWSVASRGLPRFEALTGLLYAGISLQGMERLIPPAMNALARECADQIDAEGGLPSRNPEELLEAFTLLNWAAAALYETGRTPLPPHLEAMERIAPTLRSLRHADGGLARFHGGGRGLEGRLDHALVSSGIKVMPPEGLAMGYARLASGRTTIIADVSAPPARAISFNAHASSLAFELTSGRRPLIVNCGSGAPFGAEWRRAGRATPSHSTLSIDGVSSAQLSIQAGREILSNGPAKVTAQPTSDDQGMRLIASHDGYVKGYGLTHVRNLDISFDGRTLQGEDTLGALSERDRIVFEKHMDSIALQGVPYSVRFHIHPDVEAELDLGGSAISLALKSGEVWVFRASPHVEMTLQASVFLEKGRLKPRATKQIVLSARVMEYASQVSWFLAKAQETPSYLRDFEQDLDLALK